MSTAADGLGKPHGEGPPTQFRGIGGVVRADRFGQPGGVGQGWPRIVEHDVEHHVIGNDGLPQQHFEIRPIGRSLVGPPIRETSANRLCACLAALGEPPCRRAEIQCRHVERVVRIGESLHGRFPTC